MRSVFAAVAVLLSTMVFAGSASATTLTFCSQEDPEGFDPAAFTTDATFDASSQAIYNRLIEFAPGSASLVPGLAVGWQASEDGLTWTFRLREGVAFHSSASFTPTRNFNADDVVFSFARQQNPDYAYYSYLGGQWPWFVGLGLDTQIVSVEKVDDLTVAFTLDKPDSGFPATLAMDFASILSREYAEALLDAGSPQLLNSRPIGTGPFSFATYTPGDAVEYRSNSSYWAGAPAVDTLTFDITPATADRIRMLQADECQVMAAPDAAALAATAADESLSISEVDRLDLAYLAVNSSQAPFGDVRIRKALSMAIDRAAIVDVVYGGAADTAATIVPPSMWAHEADAAEAGFNPEEAKALLAAAGVADLKLRLLVAPAARPYNPDPLRTAEMIAADLGKIGVGVEVVSTELLGEFLGEASDPDRDGAVLLGWTSDNGDAGDFLAVLLSCPAVGQSNRAQWCNLPFDDLLTAAANAPDPATRARLYREAQQILAANEPLIPLTHSIVAVPMSSSISGVVANPLGRHNFQRAAVAE